MKWTFSRLNPELKRLWKYPRYRTALPRDLQARSCLQKDVVIPSTRIRQQRSSGHHQKWWILVQSNSKARKCLSLLWTAVFIHSPLHYTRSHRRFIREAGRCVHFKLLLLFFFNLRVSVTLKTSARDSVFDIDWRRSTVRVQKPPHIDPENKCNLYLLDALIHLNPPPSWQNDMDDKNTLNSDAMKRCGALAVLKSTWLTLSSQMQEFHV